MMEQYTVPRLLTHCPLCGQRLQYFMFPRCENCNEQFKYDPDHKVFRHPKIVDISYKDYESKFLSNLFPHKFSMKKFSDDSYISFASMEAFLRYLWFDKSQVPLFIGDEIRLLYGTNAVDVKNILPDWRKTQSFFIYEGNRIDSYSKREIKRESEDYQKIIRQAYQNLFKDSALFRLALAKTKGKILIHSIGKDDPKETILTRNEFIKNLNELRDQLY